LTMWFTDSLVILLLYSISQSVGQAVIPSIAHSSPSLRYFLRRDSSHLIPFHFVTRQYLSKTRFLTGFSCCMFEWRWLAAMTIHTPRPIHVPMYFNMTSPDRGLGLGYAVMNLADYVHQLVGLFSSHERKFFEEIICKCC